MFVTIELPDEVLGRLQAEATRRGISVDDLIASFAATVMSEPAARREGHHRPAFVAVGSSKSGISDRVDELFAEGFGRD